MIQSGHLFALASIIAVFGILFAFRKFTNTIQENIEKHSLTKQVIQKEQTRYFIRAAVVEIIPILLIIFGFITTDEKVTNLALPIILILSTFVIAFANVLVLRSDLIASIDRGAQEFKSFIKSFSTFGIIHVCTFPTICFIGVVI